MSEIVVNIFSVSILHIEIQITLGHWMNLRNKGNYMETFCYLSGLVYQNKSVIADLRPLRSNAMQISALGKESPADGIG